MRCKNENHSCNSCGEKKCGNKHTTCHNADVVEVRHGEWKYNRGQAPNEKAYFCSLCVDGESDYGRDNYCPNCGAKMVGERRANNER